MSDASKDGKGDRGAMRRRHEEIIRSGVLGRLGSEGRLVFGFALCWVDYKTCQFRISARGAAKVACVSPTSIRRGIAQLIALKVIQAGPKDQSLRQRYRFLKPEGGTRSVCAPGHATCAPPVTLRAQGAHATCAGGSHSVRSART